MLEILRTSWTVPRYVVRYEGDQCGIWERRRFGEAMTGELDGDRYELRRDGRRRFVLMSSGTVLATAEAARRGSWTISVDGLVYELRRKTRLRSEMELLRDGVVLGAIRKARAARAGAVCELPAELSAVLQAFIGFVVLILWNRAASSSGTAAAAATG